MSLTTTVVETQFGKVEGVQKGSVKIWKGIPFAQAPLGSLRFRPPQQHKPWSGVRDASQFGPIAPQVPMQMEAMFGSAQVISGEDCLYLNIWSPGADNALRPVMVWIHGGAFVTGSGSTPWYEGSSFAINGDVVVVTINYRLGALGFLHLADLGADASEFTSNCGLLDQVAALEWVRDNIAAFGGDPSNVTVFGESAGAMSIGTLLAMSSSRGLFKRAILQSGAGNAVSKREAATKAASALMTELGLGTNQITVLKDVPVDQLLAAQNKVGSRRGLLAFQPAVDGITLERMPIEAIADGSAEGVEVLIGTNRNEMKLFTRMTPSTANPDEVLLHKLFGANGQQVLDTYRGALPQELAGDAWTDLTTDRTFRIPAIRLAEKQAKRGEQVWMYRFDWRTPVFGGRLGACHALEIPFVWNNLDRPGVSLFTGDSPSRQVVADYMHTAWIAFARNGNPNTSTLPYWPAYEWERRATMIFDEACKVENDPQSTERRLWDEVI
jgi:para-nitrobenzyl esterase